jgi:arsenate reductase (thioredoxin)
MEKPRVLFLCVHNSARSQMAEAFLKKYANGEFDVTSAGLEPGILNPHVVEVMKEKGIDISGNKTKSAFDLYKQNIMFSYVITVCDREAAGQCPLFPGVTTRLHWPFADPSKFTGTKDEILEKMRKVRDEIEAKVREFIDTVRGGKKFEEEDLFIIRP